MMGNRIINKIKSLFHKEKNEIKHEEVKVEKQKHNPIKIQEKDIEPKFDENKTSKVNYSKENKTYNSKNSYSSQNNRNKHPRDNKDSNENGMKHSRKNDKTYNNNIDNNKRTYNDKKYNERKIHDNKPRNSKYNSNNAKNEIDNKNYFSKIENIIKDITVGMKFESDDFKGEIIKKQSYNLSYSTGKGEKFNLTYKELKDGYVQIIKNGSIDEKWYESNFNNKVESSNLRMISAILKKI